MLHSELVVGDDFEWCKKLEFFQNEWDYSYDSCL